MIVAYLLIVSAFAVCIVFLKLWKYRGLMKVPGPSYFFIFATTFCVKLTPQDVFKNLINLNKTYGPVVKVWMNPLKPTLIVSDPKFVRLLLASNVHLDKSKFYDFFHAYMGKGIGTAEARDWKTQRKMAGPAFRGKTLENYVATMGKFTNELIATLAEKVDDPIVDVAPILSLHTLRVICATVLNLEENFARKTNVEYLKAREGYFELAIDRMLSLLKQNDFLYRLTGSYERHRSSVKVLNDFTGKIVEAYLKQTKTGGGKHLIDYLLGGYSSEDSKLIDNVSTFLVAGHDSIATVLSFTLYELAKHPDVQIKIAEERKSVSGSGKNCEFGLAQLRKMRYLECVLKESMRKYTPVPFFDRRTGEEVVIDGFRIPKGTDISICAYNIHHNEEYFPEPEEFLPERFSAENEGNVMPYAYIPFSHGPRNCIGKQFAMTQMKLILAKILLHYEIHVADTAQKMELKSEFALKSTIGTPIKLTPRIRKENNSDK